MKDFVAKDRMDSANILNSGKRMDEYKHALNNLYIHHYRVEAYKKLNDLLTGYKNLLLNLDHNFFAILTEVLDTLRATFAENANVLSQGIKTKHTYSWKILSVKEIQQSLDAVVKGLDLNQTLYAMMSKMFENCTKWITQDENEISKMISDFILELFREATQKTMTDYLKEKFNVSNIALLVNAIEREIIEELWDKLTGK